MVLEDNLYIYNLALDITPESKNSLSITNQGKTPTGAEVTWDSSSPRTWDDYDKGTWDILRLPIVEESKNNLDITNEDKN